MRAGEVLETVPGMIVSQHSGEGKANQYYLRGFNLDHGTDFSTTVAGVPVNTPTGAHAHGYADVSFLIPELVSGVQFKKGPYFADEGDFSAAGAANINYVNVARSADGATSALDRMAGAASSPRPRRRSATGHLLAALELNHNDGPWVRPDDYRQDQRRAALQPRRRAERLLAHRHGLLGRLGFDRPGAGRAPSPTARSRASASSIRAIAARPIGRAWPPTSSDRSAAARCAPPAFVLRNSLDLFSNFTYFLDDPDNGDQFEQAERRLAAGGRVTYRRLGHFFERHVESSAGLQIRHDRLDPVGLYHTTDGAAPVDDARRSRWARR